MAPILTVLVNLLLAHWVLAVPAGNEPRQSDRCTKENLAPFLPAGEGASVEIASHVNTGGGFEEPLAANPAYKNATGLPALCAAIIKVTSGNSSYRFGIFLPDVWNSDFIGVGSYAQAGGINWADMAPAVKYGMATVSTDTGHISLQGELKWARDRPGSLEDWGYQAVNGTIHIGKAITKAYYPTTTAFGKSYWNGCSTGGRQGLKQIQISPESLDGVLIGAPAWDTKHIFPWIARLATYNLSGPGQLFSAQVGVILNLALLQCDADKDGRRDFIISDPDNCKLDFTNVTCTSGPRDDCLTTDQINTANKIYSDYPIPNSDFNQSGLYPGSELQWFTFMSDSSRDGSEAFDLQYFKQWLYPDESANPRWDDYVYFLRNESEIVIDSGKRNPGSATADNFDIAAFRERKGKIIMYHGMADGTVPTRSSRQYYQNTQQALRIDQAGMDDFFRFFPMPGMAHCWPNFLFNDWMNAPWMIAGAGQNAMSGEPFSVRGHLRDPEYDALAAVMNWVVNGTAPDKIIASALDNFGNPTRERPICPWPKQASFDNTSSSNPDKADGWSCS